MPIQTACPLCRTAYTLADEQAGKNVRCRNCRNVFVVAAAPPLVNELVTVEIVAEPPRPKPPPLPTRPPAVPLMVQPVQEENRPPQQSLDERHDSTNLPWIIGGAVVAVLLLLGSGLTVFFLVREKAPAEQASNSLNAPDTPKDLGDWPTLFGQPRSQAKPAPPVNPNPQPLDPITKPVEPDAKPIEPMPVPDDPMPRPVLSPATDPSPAPASSNGKIPPEAIDKAKRATVYIKVTLANGSIASGSGFFGVADARNLVLTNAHVVGMLSSESRPPRSVEVVANSGQPDERRCKARVMGVDRSSDLAVLDVGNAAGLPEPLTVKAAAGLRELTELYTFGFPLGEQLGKEITIRPTSVSSLRKKGGTLDRIQVNGGMDPGNSGGPVVDASGHVVGVAVAGIEGRLINFAIPGERVHSIVNGRLSEIGLHQPFIDGDRIGVPVIMVLIDPRERVQQVALDVWIGDKPPDNRRPRPSSSVEPALQAGDSSRQRYVLPYDRPSHQAQGEVMLPPKPPDKVYWIQPNWTNASGHKHWLTGTVYVPPAPVERKPAMLALHTSGGSAHPVVLSSTNTFRVSADDDDDEEGVVFQLRTKAHLDEQITAASAEGMSLRLQYKQAACEMVLDKKAQPVNVPPTINRLAILMQFDAKGNLSRNELDPSTLRQALGGAGLHSRVHGPGRSLMPSPLPTSRSAGPRSRVQSSGALQQINKIHEPIKNALNTLIVPLPGREVQVKETWSSVRQTLVGGGDDDDRPARLEMTYTYVGQRTTSDGRTEAVIAINGVLRGLPGKEGQLSGKATGNATVDLATGQVSKCDMKVTTDTEMTFLLRGGGSKTLRVLNIQVAHLQRGL